MTNFNLSNWLNTIITSFMVSLPIFYFIKSWAKDKKEQREAELKDKKEQREHDKKERELDRKQREKENLTNMKEFFSILYKEANKELLESFRELQNDYKKYLIELMKSR